VPTSEIDRRRDCRVSAKLVPTSSDRGVPRSQRCGSSTAVISLYNPEPLLFLSSSSSIVPTRLSGPRSRSTNSQKIWECLELYSDLWICGQELWPLDRRCGPPLQLSIQFSPQRAPKWPNNKPHGATRKQATAKTPAKWPGYQIPSVIVVFIILVFRV
jgi:hypothetical protein